MFSVSVANCTGLDILDVLKINHDQTHKLWWHSYIGYKCKELMQCSVRQWTYSRVYGNCSISILHSQHNIWFLNILKKNPERERHNLLHTKTKLTLSTTTLSCEAGNLSPVRFWRPQWHSACGGGWAVEENFKQKSGQKGNSWWNIGVYKCQAAHPCFLTIYSLRERMIRRLCLLTKAGKLCLWYPSNTTEQGQQLAF